MKILIPTAKELNTQVAQIEPESLSEKTKLIIQALSQYSVTDLAQLYQIRPEKAEEEYQRIQELQNETAPTYPALYLFDGLMYRNIKRKNLRKEEERYIRNHLLITSSLYGVIPALVPIAPHCSPPFGLYDKAQGRKAIIEKAVDRDLWSSSCRSRNSALPLV